MKLVRRTLLALFVAATTIAALPAAAQTDEAQTDKAQTDKARVTVIASLHGLHASNPAFSFERLYETVAALEPDFVGVEIRPEDTRNTEEALARQYPREMIHLLKIYEGRAFGFDWLGQDLEGRQVPENYWREQSIIAQLQRTLGEGLPQTPERTALKERHVELGTSQLDIAATASPAGMTDGRYDRASEERYQVFGQMVEGTPWQALSDFYRLRDEKIAANSLDFIRANPGKRIVLVTGADHHGPLVKALSAYPETIEIVPLAD